MALSSSLATKSQTPLRACTPVPPSADAVTVSPSASSTIRGPVRNIDALAVIITKSVSAGE